MSSHDTCPSSGPSGTAPSSQPMYRAGFATWASIGSIRGQRDAMSLGSLDSEVKS